MTLFDIYFKFNSLHSLQPLSSSSSNAQEPLCVEAKQSLPFFGFSSGAKRLEICYQKGLCDKKGHPHQKLKDKPFPVIKGSKPQHLKILTSIYQYITTTRHIKGQEIFNPAPQKRALPPAQEDKVLSLTPIEYSYTIQDIVKSLMEHAQSHTAQKIAKRRHISLEQAQEFAIDLKQDPQFVGSRARCLLKAFFLEILSSLFAEFLSVDEIENWLQEDPQIREEIESAADDDIRTIADGSAKQREKMCYTILKNLVPKVKNYQNKQQVLSICRHHFHSDDYSSKTQEQIQFWQQLLLKQKGLLNWLSKPGIQMMSLPKGYVESQSIRKKGIEPLDISIVGGQQRSWLLSIDGLCFSLTPFLSVPDENTCLNLSCTPFSPAQYALSILTGILAVDGDDEISLNSNLQLHSRSRHLNETHLLRCLTKMMKRPGSPLLDECLSEMAGHFLVAYTNEKQICKKLKIYLENHFPEATANFKTVFLFNLCYFLQNFGDLPNENIAAIWKEAKQEAVIESSLLKEQDFCARIQAALVDKAYPFSELSHCLATAAYSFFQESLVCVEKATYVLRLGKSDLPLLIPFKPQQSFDTLCKISDQNSLLTILHGLFEALIKESRLTFKISSSLLEPYLEDLNFDPSQVLYGITKLIECSNSFLSLIGSAALLATPRLSPKHIFYLFERAPILFHHSFSLSFASILESALKNTPFKYICQTHSFASLKQKIAQDREELWITALLESRVSQCCEVAYRLIRSYKGRKEVLQRLNVFAIQALASHYPASALTCFKSIVDNNYLSHSQLCKLFADICNGFQARQSQETFPLQSLSGLAFYLMEKGSSKSTHSEPNLTFSASLAWLIEQHHVSATPLDGDDLLFYASLQGCLSTSHLFKCWKRRIEEALKEASPLVFYLLQKGEVYLKPKKVEERKQFYDLVLQTSQLYVKSQDKEHVPLLRKWIEMLQKEVSSEQLQEQVHHLLIQFIESRLEDLEDLSSYYLLNHLLSQNTLNNQKIAPLLEKAMQRGRCSTYQKELDAIFSILASPYFKIFYEQYSSSLKEATTSFLKHVFTRLSSTHKQGRWTVASFILKQNFSSKATPLDAALLSDLFDIDPKQTVLKDLMSNYYLPVLQYLQQANEAKRAKDVLLFLADIATEKQTISYTEWVCQALLEANNKVEHLESIIKILEREQWKFLSQRKECFLVIHSLIDQLLLGNHPLKAIEWLRKSFAMQQAENLKTFEKALKLAERLFEKEQPIEALSWLNEILPFSNKRDIRSIQIIFEKLFEILKTPSQLAAGHKTLLESNFKNQFKKEKEWLQKITSLHIQKLLKSEKKDQSVMALELVKLYSICDAVLWGALFKLALHHSSEAFKISCYSLLKELYHSLEKKQQSELWAFCWASAFEMMGKLAPLELLPYFQNPALLDNYFNPSQEASLVYRSRFFILEGLLSLKTELISSHMKELIDEYCFLKDAQNAPTMPINHLEIALIEHLSKVNNSDFIEIISLLAQRILEDSSKKSSYWNSSFVFAMVQSVLIKKGNGKRECQKLVSLLLTTHCPGSHFVCPAPLQSQLIHLLTSLIKVYQQKDASPAELQVILLIILANLSKQKKYVYTSDFKEAFYSFFKQAAEAQEWSLIPLLHDILELASPHIGLSKDQLSRLWDKHIECYLNKVRDISQLNEAIKNKQLLKKTKVTDYFLSHFSQTIHNADHVKARLEQFLEVFIAEGFVQNEKGQTFIRFLELSLGIMRKASLTVPIYYNWITDKLKALKIEENYLVKYLYEFVWEKLGSSSLSSEEKFDLLDLYFDLYPLKAPFIFTPVKHKENMYQLDKAPNSSHLINSQELIKRALDRGLFRKAGSKYIYYNLYCDSLSTQNWLALSVTTGMKKEAVLPIFDKVFKKFTEMENNPYAIYRAIKMLKWMTQFLGVNHAADLKDYYFKLSHLSKQYPQYFSDVDGLYRHLYKSTRFYLQASEATLFTCFEMLFQQYEDVRSLADSLPKIQAGVFLVREYSGLSLEILSCLTEFEGLTRSSYINLLKTLESYFHAVAYSSATDENDPWVQSRLIITILLKDFKNLDSQQQAEIKRLALSWFRWASIFTLEAKSWEARRKGILNLISIIQKLDDAKLLISKDLDHRTFKDLLKYLLEQIHLFKNEQAPLPLLNSYLQICLHLIGSLIPIADTLQYKSLLESIESLLSIVTYITLNHEDKEKQWENYQLILETISANPPFDVEGQDLTEDFCCRWIEKAFEFIQNIESTKDKNEGFANLLFIIRRAIQTGTISSDRIETVGFFTKFKDYILAQKNPSFDLFFDLIEKRFYLTSNLAQNEYPAYIKTLESMIPSLLEEVRKSKSLLISSYFIGLLFSCSQLLTLEQQIQQAALFVEWFKQLDSLTCEANWRKELLTHLIRSQNEGLHIGFFTFKVPAIKQHLLAVDSFKEKWSKE